MANENLNIREAFRGLQTRRDVANLLGVSEATLCYALYSAPLERYRTFDIPKRNGGTRTIQAPSPLLKHLQRNLNQVLQEVYRIKPPVHGFVRGKGVLSNARSHLRNRWVLNLDLADYFGSVNFGRVRGMFMIRPYNLDAHAATILAQICCFENSLPQGAPTSPVVANMISAKLDSQLLKLAKDNYCYYTRYADDITFSTTLNRFPGRLAWHNEEKQRIDIGIELDAIISQNGFAVNAAKTRLYPTWQRQQVTNITVNQKTNTPLKYISNVRALLHNWEKLGLSEATERHFSRKPGDVLGSDINETKFRQIVKGKLAYMAMVRGRDDPLYRKYFI